MMDKTWTGLPRATVPSVTVRDVALAPGGEEDHLIFPGVGAERPTMTENDGLAGSLSL